MDPVLFYTFLDLQVLHACLKKKKKKDTPVSPKTTKSEYMDVPWETPGDFAVSRLHSHLPDLIP